MERWQGKETVFRAVVTGLAASSRCRMISREALARVKSGRTEMQSKPGAGVGFGMENYLTGHSLTVTRRKPWSSQPGGLVFELEHCPFNASHINGSAAFTVVGGVPGFRCQHDGCRG